MLQTIIAGQTMTATNRNLKPAAAAERKTYTGNNAKSTHYTRQSGVYVMTAAFITVK